ncbi:MAG: glycosyltransferase family 4 protein, partial [Methanomicrobiales archaeon]|nr:glycosyltransferase family 4 protein [Methanomicrobiales archaeon]
MDRKQQRGLTFLCLDIVNPPHTANGSEIHKFEFLDNLAGKIETLIVLCRGDVPFAPRRGLRCIRLAGGNIFLTYLHFFVFLLGNAVFLDCDVLYTRGSSFGYFGSKILRLHKNTRLVVEVNGILDDEYALRGDRMRGGKRLGSLRMRMNWTIAHRMERYFLTHADTFIAVTEGIRQHL